MIDRKNNRQALINQMRAALNILTSPSYTEIHEVVEFTIGDTDYCFTEEQLQNFDFD